MKFRYTTIYSIKGIILPEGDKELVVDTANGMCAILTIDPSPYSFEGDRMLSVATLMLKALFRSEPTSNEFKERVASAGEEIRVARRKEFGNDPFLVIVVEGEIPFFNPSVEKDADEFIVCFDGADKDEIRACYTRMITIILNSITMEVENVIGIKKVTDSVIFLREDGKPIYSYTASAGSARAYVSRQLEDGQIQSIRNLYNRFTEDSTLQRVQFLLRSSLEFEEDPLRSFLAAWSAFEIFINKVFITYENRIFMRILEEGHSGALNKYLERIREVMKDKYRLVDKFAAVSIQLSSETADEDVKTVLQVKNIRDDLLHGQSVDEAALPVQSIRALVRKYLRLHFENEGRKVN